VGLGVAYRHLINLVQGIGILPLFFFEVGYCSVIFLKVDEKSFKIQVNHLIKIPFKKSQRLG
jgi:hypothetical protein